MVRLLSLLRSWRNHQDKRTFIFGRNAVFLLSFPLKLLRWFTSLLSAGTNVSYEEMKQFSASGKKNVVDVREDNEVVSDGVVPNSVHIPRKLPSIMSTVGRWWDRSGL